MDYFIACPTGFAKNECRPFVVGGQQVGLVRPDVFRELLNYPEVFCIREGQGDRKEVKKFKMQKSIKYY